MWEKMNVNFPPKKTKDFMLTVASQLRDSVMIITNWG